MFKDIVIAVLIGFSIGTLYVHATPAAIPSMGNISTQQLTITRKDLIEAAALCGMLANQHHDPFGNWGFGRAWRGPEDFSAEAKEYAKRAE